MSNNKINSMYTVEDIHDYLSGKMTAPEMHDIEKAALDDPLLAEAIEGYNEVPEFTQEQGLENINEHLIELRAKFIGPKQTVVSINKYKLVWRIAAAILLLVGSAVLVTYFTDNFKSNPSQNIAKVEPGVVPTPVTVLTDTAKTTAGFDSEVKIKQPEITTVKKDKPAAVIVENKTKEESFESDEQQSVAGTNAPEKEMKALEDEKITTTTTIPAPIIERNATIAEKRKEELNQKKIAQNNAKNVIFSGKVVDKNNKPVPFVTLKTEEGLMSTTDNRGMFSLPITRKKPGKVTFRANNFLQKTVPISGNYQVIVLENNRVSNSNTNNNNLARSQNKPGQVLLLNKNGAEPKEGWDKYLNFLIERVSYSEYDTGKPVIGETIVTFDIKANGEPSNFSFEKQIDTDVNDAIEDLIITGPEWKLIDGYSTIGHVKLKIIF